MYHENPPFCTHKQNSIMARRIPLNNPDDVIRCLEEDGGVILTDFSSVNDLHTVNQDVAPYINAIAEEL